MARRDRGVNLTGKRFVRFCMVGSSGAVIQSSAFYLLFHVLGVPDFVRVWIVPIPWALAFSILAAMSWNFVLDLKWALGDVEEPTT